MKTKKKLAIVSSYNEMCGNATYAEVLRKAFMKHFEVEVIPLNVRLLKETHKKLKKLGDESIQELAKKLRQFDYVNIQFEAGLFGSHPKQVVKRFKTLAKNSKNLLTTIHRYDHNVAIVGKSVLKDLANFAIRNAVKKTVNHLKQRYFAKMYEKVIKACIKNKSGIMVHTKRESFLISKTFNYAYVYDHPITFLKQHEFEQYQAQISRSGFLKTYGLSDTDTLLGIFGFIADYKGYYTLFQAMRFLPENYKLLVFGSQHPGSIQQNELVDISIEKLLDIIEQDNEKKLRSKKHVDISCDLKSRIKFAGSLDDDDFIKAIMSCDINVLPYLETNQSGSGVAALTLDSKANAIFSMNYSFMELSKYAPGCFRMFSIGNYMELAECIKQAKAKPIQALNEYGQKYNVDTNIALHLKVFDQIDALKLQR